MQRSTSVETIVSEYQVEGKITSTAEGEDINANPQNLLTVETARPITLPFRFEATNRLFGSVDTSSGDDTLFRIAKTSKRTAPHRKAADFSPITANRLEEKANKKYRHIRGLSVKGLTEKFTQISEENLSETTSVRTDTFVLQPMFNKGRNSNKFQMEAWTGKKGVSKSLRKMDGTSKGPKEDKNRAAQIEAALKKCNPDILDRINRGKSALENEKQMDNSFDANRDKPNAEDVAEDIEESESSLSSRMASPSPGQYSSKSLGKKPMSVKANQEEGWQMVVYGTKRHVLFVQVLNILEKIMWGGSMISWEMLVTSWKLVAGKWQSAVVEYSNQEEATRAVDQWLTMVRKDAVRIYLMIGTQKIIEQRKTWEAKLVGLPQNCTAHYLSTTLDQISAQSCFIPRTSKNYTRMGCTYVRFDSKASHNNATKKPLVIGDTLVHWVPTDAKKCYFCYQVGHLVSKCSTLHKKKERDTKKVTNNIRLAKLYVKRNVPEENIKAFSGRSYADMAALRLLHNRNNNNPNNTQKPGLQVNNREEQSKKGDNQPWKSEIDKLRQQVNEMVKLLNAVAAKLEVTIKKGEKVIVTQQPSDTSEEKEVVEMGLPNQSTMLKSIPAEKKEAYNPELEIKEIKKTLEPILELLKQVKKQSSWSSSTAGESKSMETDNVLWWVIDEQFDFVIVMETKMTPTKEKGVFFGSDEYHAFWESSTEKQMGTGVGILVKKCWIHHVETIRGFHGRLLHLGLKFRGRINVHIVGLYMPASKSPTERAVAKEIRKLLGDIVQNKEIIIVAGDLNDNLLSKSLKKTYATNKAKACPTATTLQHMNLVDTHEAYATNNPEKTWASNGIQRRLDYVFTDAVTASLVTNIGVIDVNESFSTDHKAVVTIIRSDRILAGTKKSRSGKKKCSTTMIDVKKASGV
ncbi:hypothetical protein G9A89_016659 [Geosiphon pyriformis]|nr:hypothetical protein G9A89_016659 [Geosiphon pyriformis]